MIGSEYGQGPYCITRECERILVLRLQQEFEAFREAIKSKKKETIFPLNRKYLLPETFLLLIAFREVRVICNIFSDTA